MASRTRKSTGRPEVPRHSESPWGGPGSLAVSVMIRSRVPEILQRKGSIMMAGPGRLRLELELVRCFLVPVVEEIRVATIGSARLGATRSNLLDLQGQCRDSFYPPARRGPGRPGARGEQERLTSELLGDA